MPFPHLFMAISVALVAALIGFFLLAPGVSAREERHCTGAVTMAGQSVLRCGAGAMLDEQEFVDIR